MTNPMIGQIAADHSVIGAARSGPLSRITIWASFAGMAASAAVVVGSFVHGW
jgi:hypothetical protein